MAATGKVLGTVTAVVGEAKATAADGTVRVLQVGDVVHSDEVITTNAAGSINIALESGKTLDCGANTDLTLHESILGLATATAAAPSAISTPAAPGSVEALQQAIASGQDPSQIAPATAAGGAPAAGGAGGDGSGGTPVVLEQASTSSVVTSGFPTAGDTIAFPAQEFTILPIEEQPPVVQVSVQVQVQVAVEVQVSIEGQPDVLSGPAQGGVFAVSASGDAVSLLEGTMEGTNTIPFVITLDKAFDTDVQVTYQIVSDTASMGTDFFDGQAINTITIPAGETSLTVPIQIVRDHFVEANESFHIVLIDAVNATINPEHSSAAVTIFNDDANPVANADTNWVQEDSNVVASGSVLQSGSHAGAPAPSGAFADAADTDFEPLTVTNPGTYAGTYGTLVLGADGSYTYTLNNANPAVQALDSGETLTDSFGYSVTDGFNTPDTSTVTISIFGSNDVPEIKVKTGGEIFATGAEGTVNEAGLADGSSPSLASSSVPGSFQVSDTDGVDDIASVTINGQTVAIGSLVGATFNGSAGVMTVNSYSGGVASFTYELKQAVTDGAGAETDVFTLTASDGTSSSAPAKITITIVDDMPTAVNDGTSTAEDTPVTVNVLTNDVSGADAGKTLLSATLATTGAGSLSFNANGTVTFNPAAGFEGPATINYTMRDADGDQSSASLVVTVGPDSVPQITAAADTLVDETGGLDSVVGALTASFGADVPGTIALSASGATWNASTHTLSANDGSWRAVDNGNGTYTFTQLQAMSHLDASNPDDAILINITAKATDSEGDSTTLGFTVTVKDDGPSAVNDTAGTPEDTQIKVNVLANDSAGQDGGATLLSASLATQGAGSLSFNANGTVTFNPAAGFEGPATINYTMRDADGDQSSASLVVTVGPDSVPQITAAADTLVDETGGLDSVVGALTASFGADVPGTIALSASGATWNASTHTLSANDGSWRAVDNGNGTYTFTQLQAMSHLDASNPDDAILINITAKATDSEGDSTTLGFTVTVKDDGPVAAADTGSATEGLTTTVALNGVLSNDAIGTDGSGVVVGITAGNTGANSNSGVGSQIAGAHGMLTLNSDGSYSYVADASVDSGVQDVFTYTIRDADGDLSHATLTITFEGDRNVPSAQDDAKQILEALLPGGSDPGADSNTVSGTVVFGYGLDGAGSITLDSMQGTYGTMSMNAQGNWVYTLAGRTTDVANQDQAETDTFSYTVKDSDGSQAHGTIVITIVDDVPMVFEPEKAHLDNVAGSPATFALDFDSNVQNNTGADQPGTVTFANITNGQLSGLTSGGMDIHYYLTNGGATLVGATGGDVNTGKVFTIALNAAAGSYTVDMDGAVDNGAGVVFNDLSGGQAGNPPFKIIPSTSADPLEMLCTPINDNSVNSDSDDIAVGSQFIDTANPDKGLRIDFGDFTFLPHGGGSSDDAFTMENHTTINGFRFTIDQVANGTIADVGLKLYNANEDVDKTISTANFGDDPLVAITQIRIYDNLGVLVGTATGDTTFALPGEDIVVDFQSDGTATVTGLRAQYSITTESLNGYDRIEILNIGTAGTHNAPSEDGKFSLSHLRVETVQLGNPVDMKFDLNLTDADGDTSSGVLNVSLEPTALTGADTFTGNANANTLYGGASNDNLSGLGDNDTLVGGSGNDTLDGGSGNDILTGGLGNDMLTGGTGADTYKWAAGDHGTGSPSVDTIVGFDGVANSDKLDLSELLQGENSGNLGAYLHFTSTNSGADTTIEVRSLGGANPVDHKIVLQGVPMATLGADDATIISNLVSQGKLITD